jgi:hypothetical protein
MSPDIQEPQPPACPPLYDRESTLQEVLRTEVTKWFDRGWFDSSAVIKLRNAVRSINGMPAEHSLRILPEDIQRLHCMHFTDLSPGN